MRTYKATRKKAAGYTLVEVLVASVILGTVLGGSIKAVGTMTIAENTARSGTVGVTFIENAARLWQLGLTPTQALGILPVITNNECIGNAVVESGVNAVTFGTATTTAMANSMGNMETITVTAVVENPQGASLNRTTQITVYRPESR